MTQPANPWDWDAEVNMGYFEVDEAAVAYSKTFTGGNADRITVDYDEDGNVVGVEVFG